MIEKLNRRIQLKAWGSEQDDIGAPRKTLLNYYGIWAQVEDRSGHLYLGQEQTTWNYDYKITFRYEKTRPVASNMTIDYDGKRLAINSVSYQNEGNRRYTIVRCSTTDQAISSPDGDIIEPTTDEAGEKNYKYYGIGSETSWSAISLAGKTILGAFKDGQNFEVITTGTPVGKQVKYDVSTGGFEWGVPYTPDEFTLIQYE